VKTGVLVMAYGTPRRRGVEAYTRVSATVAHRAPNCSRTSCAVTTPLAVTSRSPSAPRQVAGIASASNKWRRLYDVRFGSKYEPPLLEETAPVFAMMVSIS